jgi:16S rRNA (uracil1498-N3)-methyltransferase
MIRLFVPDPLAEGAQIDPSPDQARYLVNVMRRAAGDEVLLFNGADGEWRARIVEITRRGCSLSATARTRDQQTGPDLDLVVALVKRPRLETIVEKAAELGARRVRPVITRFTNADHTNIGRLRAIAIEAAEQTGRLDVPEIAEPVRLEAMLAGWPGDRALLFCDEAGDARPVIDALADATSGTPWAILIGPEGGFSAEERSALRGEAFVTPVTLGPRILRADTAAISAMTLWQAKLGDWARSGATP